MGILKQVKTIHNERITLADTKHGYVVVDTTETKPWVTSGSTTHKTASYEEAAKIFYTTIGFNVYCGIEVERLV